MREKEARHEKDVGAVGRGGHRTAAGDVVAGLREESGGAADYRWRSRRVPGCVPGFYGTDLLADID